MGLRVSIFLVIVFAAPSVSAGWLDFWRNADQNGKELLDAGDPAQAAQTFKNPLWRGVAQYEAGEYQRAADEFARAEGVGPLYNRATSLAAGGELQASLDLFDQLLQQQPDHEDGIANREWVRRQLENQQEQQQQQQQSDQNSESQDQQDQQSQQADNQQNEENDGSQQGGGSKPEDGRQMTSKDNAEGQQGQQSAEDSLKSALQNQQEPAAQPGKEPNREQPVGELQQATDSQNMEVPYTEASQAIEQQLQRIPDDPAGLLRNKLYVTHQSRYADVKEGENPW